ncbi:MAG TPA: YkgJ family cysteine cluster protein [Methylococcaceae bacterium]|jgi:Fe-S-cluster containining protein|nr:YkgJ family cysteine cluster protein [Methylococcaceae bacterium]HIN68061.1 YkgJ family cysteine cluster protein [Methylococcales bacterium]HIA45331.1 YkgJ family cysteine cluster protein [Methylococcaceae bacterium]HIB63374.1 YkgJ family cysteine cluster protein [Methylococcaceae bacterium]HIO13248.1 YkgJ family cysteine cluster protein [Methylococcales bacterium]
MECRVGCGACCIAPTISSPIPGMPAGKPAGIRCVQLTENNQCKLFNTPERPVVCSYFKAVVEVCGRDNQHAMELIVRLEVLTQ